MKKFLVIILIVLVCSLFLCTLSFAGSIQEIVGREDGDIGPKLPSGDDRIGPIVNQILGVIQWFAYAIAVGMLIFVGIKYTMAAADQRADLKSYMIKYVIGAVIIGGAGSIMTIMYNWMNTVYE